MRNFVIAAAVVLIVAAGVVLNSVRINAVCAELDTLLDAGDYRAAFEKWEANRPYLEFFIRDGEIDGADLHLRELLRANERGDRDGEQEHLVGLHDALREIINYETVSFRSIFKLIRVDNRDIKV